jgi:serine/threonine protein kinase
MSTSGAGALPMALDSRPRLPSGTVLDGSYRVEGVLGAGGFGIVYLATDVNLETQVAVKEYYPSLHTQRDASYQIRSRYMFQRKSYERGLTSFLREARTLARFEHPSIVRVTRVFEANKTAYMVMRLETGHNFEHWLRTLTRSPTQKELDTFLSALLSAMEMLHAACFLHRDIAPDNIIIRSDGLPVLLDFGAVTSKKRSLRFAKHDVIIKPRYSAPEHYDANSAARTEGPWSDIYSLGATLFRAVKGIPPAEAHIRLREDYLPTAVDPGPHSGYRRNFLDAIDACMKLQQGASTISVGSAGYSQWICP